MAALKFIDFDGFWDLARTEEINSVAEISQNFPQVEFFRMLSSRVRKPCLWNLRPLFSGMGCSLSHW